MMAVRMALIAMVATVRYPVPGGSSQSRWGYQVVCVNTSKEVSTDDGCRDERAGAGRAGAGDGGGAGRGGQVGPGRFAGRVDGPSRRGLIAVDRGGRVFA